MFSLRYKWRVSRHTLLGKVLRELLRRYGKGERRAFPTVSNRFECSLWLWEISRSHIRPATHVGIFSPSRAIARATDLMAILNI